MPDFDLSADEQAMYEVIPKNGSTIGNYKARQHLGWDEERYWSARDSLVDRGLIARGVGRGGTLFRVSEKHAEAEVTVAVPLENPAQAVQAAVAAVQREDGLYEPLAKVVSGAWARDRRSQLLSLIHI
mgnify:FL=1